MKICTLLVSFLTLLASCQAKMEEEMTPSEEVVSCSFRLSLPEDTMALTKAGQTDYQWKVFFFNDDYQYQFAEEGNISLSDPTVQLDLVKDQTLNILFLLSDGKTAFPQLKAGQTYWELGLRETAGALEAPRSLLVSRGGRDGLLKIYTSGNFIPVEMVAPAVKVVLENDIKDVEVKSIIFSRANANVFWGLADAADETIASKLPEYRKISYSATFSADHAVYILPDVANAYEGLKAQLTVLRKGQEETVKVTVPELMSLRLSAGKCYYLRLTETSENTLSAAWTTRSVTRKLKVVQQNHWRLGADEMIEHFRRSGADVLCSQECQNVDDELIRKEGYYVYSHNNDHQKCTMISRYPIEGQTPNRYGVYLNLGKGIKVLVLNCHANYKPYGPYQFNGIPYAGYEPVDPEDPAMVAKVMEDNRVARQEMVDLLLDDLKASKTNSVILCGDFNEPSWLDWTAEAKAAGIYKAVAQWPTTKSLSEGGFNGDAYRTIHPDPVKFPGFTWSSVTDPNVKDTKDRIDFVLYPKNNAIKVESCQIIGESAATSDIVLDPWIFDHRGVVTVFEFSK